MELQNETDWPAELMRCQLFYRDLIMATLVCKTSYRMEPDGHLSHLSEPEPLYDDDQDFGPCTVDTDRVPKKKGCDFAVVGHARSPGARPTTRLSVSVELGSLRRRLNVVGDRCWDVKGRSIVPTAPAPFVALPLSYSRSFGGTTRHPAGYDLAFQANPGGRGFACVADEVSGIALPNLEEPTRPITQWNDYPPPAGLAPLPRDSVLRSGGLVLGEGGQSVGLAPSAFNFSHPNLLLSAYPAGQRLRLSGVLHEGDLVGCLPFDPLSAELVLGGRVHHLPLTPDTILVFPDRRVLTVTHRTACVYQFLPERVRTLTLTARPCPYPEAFPTIADPGRIPVEPAMELPVPAEQLLTLNPLTPVLRELPLCASR